MNTFGFMQDIKATPSPKRLDVLPVSVLEIAASGTEGIRGKNDHDLSSSRTGYSPFPYEVAELSVSLYLSDCKLILDPFAGWGERHEAAKRNGVSYIGFDTSPEGVIHAEETYGVINLIADSRTVEVPEHDGLLTCPPYWNLEQYAGEEGLDQLPTWEEFVDQYRSILHRFASKAKTGAFYCIATGDWRADNRYYDLTFQTELIMKAAGFEPHDKVVISRLGISKVKIMLPQAKRLRYTVKVHEMLTVWRKP